MIGSFNEVNVMRNGEAVLRVNIKPIDITIARRLVLPHPWPELEQEGFHPDLIDRAKAHLAWCQKNGYEENARIILASLGAGFKTPFSQARFSLQAGQNESNLRRSALMAITELAKFYSNRISSVVWNSLAHLAVRENPEEERSIVKEAKTGALPHHYMIVDSALHATGLVYTFMLHVQSAMFSHTGRILVHNCDCNCSLVNLEQVGGRIEFTLPPEKILPTSQSVFTHLVAETVKLTECGLPFAYSLSEESRDLLEVIE